MNISPGNVPVRDRLDYLYAVAFQDSPSVEFFEALEVLEDEDAWEALHRWGEGDPTASDVLLLESLGLIDEGEVERHLDQLKAFEEIQRKAPEMILPDETQLHLRRLAHFRGLSGERWASIVRPLVRQRTRWFGRSRRSTLRRSPTRARSPGDRPRSSEDGPAADVDREAAVS